MARKPAPVLEHEIAIKLSAGDLEKVFNLFARQVGRKNVTHKFFPRDYFDTHDLVLDAHNESWRIQYKRGDGGKLGGYEQTVKLSVDPENMVLEEGASLRREHKDIIPGKTPSFEKISDKAARTRMSQLIKNKPLKHIFTAEIERRFFNIASGKGKDKAVIEIAFENGMLLLPDRSASEPYVGIEIELKSGNAKALSRLKEKILGMASSAEIQPKTKNQLGTDLHRRNKS